MANQGPTFVFRTQDLTLESDGQVRILDPQLARSVAAAMAAEPDMEVRGEPTTNNCHGGNCAKGCGSK